MKNLILLLIALVIFLGQSCTVYQDTSISLEQARDQGKVQVVTIEGREIKFKKIIVEDDIYYGVGSQPELSTVLLKSESIESIFLQNKTKSILFSALLISPIAVLLIYSMANSEGIF